MKQHEPELDAADDGRVTDALDSLGLLEPPAAFVAEVMSRTKPAAVRHIGERVGSPRPGRRSSHPKKVLIGVIGLAAAGIFAAYVSGVPRTSGFGTEGTIGAAQRYEVQNGSAGTNAASPELKAFTHTAAYGRLVHDTQAMAALADPRVVSTLGDPQVQQILGSRAFQAALARPAFQQILASPELQRALTAGVRQAISTPAFQAALATPGLQAALASPEFVAGLATQGFVSQLQALSAAGRSGSDPSPEK